MPSLRFSFYLCSALLLGANWVRAETVPAISGDAIRDRIKVLSSDEYEGRAPGTPGEEKTVAFLVSEFQRLGLAPGNPDGTYTQAVPMVGLTAKPTVSFAVGGRNLDLTFINDHVAITRRVQPHLTVKDSDVVFVGYGVVAPEYGWDDYKGLDVRGKTVVMLINDPPVPDAHDPSKLDAAMFKGKAMTYYGRWTYKYEIASEKGAAACIIVHETGPAGYPWAVVAGSWGRENFDLNSPDGNAGRVGVESWITLDVAKQLFSAAGQDFDALKKAAVSRDFRPVPLAAKFNCTIENTIRHIDSRNVIARLEGSDPKLKNEYVIYTAHWDHLGRDPKLEGDQIFNGALDNASGTAAIVEIAHAYKARPTPPKRSILFLAVTGEEQGLLGSSYYARNPLYPLEQTLAVLNIDGIQLLGPSRDIEVVGYGNSTIDEIAARILAQSNRVLVPDTEPGKGFFFRSDQFEFAKRGVPAFYTHSGKDIIGKPPGYGVEKREEYTEKDYHKVSDEMKPWWDFNGAVEDAKLFFAVGNEIANSTQWPEWKPGTEFKATREAMLKK